MAEERVVLLEPQGDVVTDRTPLAPRLADLDGKLVYLLDIGKRSADVICEAIADYLKERFPRIKTAYLRKRKSYKAPEREFSPELYGQKEGKADAVIMTLGD